MFISTKKKNLSLAGTQIPNPLTIQERKKFLGKIGISAFIIVAIGVILIPTGILTMKLFTMAVSVLGIIIPTCYFYTMYRSSKTSEVERSRLLAYIPLFIAGVMFWSIQEQGSIVLARYADERTQLYFAGLEM